MPSAVPASKPSGKLRPIHFGSMFFSTAAIALCIAALLTQEWYNISYSGTSYKYGVYKMCVGSSCAKITYADNTVGCTRLGKDWESRTTACFALTIIGAILSLFSYFAVFVSRGKAPAVIALLTSVLSMGALTAVCVGYPFTLHAWYYCGVPFCDFAFGALNGTGSCESFFGYSFAFVIVATASTIVSSLINVFSLARYSCTSAPAAPKAAPIKSEELSERHHGAEGRAANDTDATQVVPSQTAAASNTRIESQPQHANNNRQVAVAPRDVEVNRNASNALPAAGINMDGWELDPNTGLYWSDGEKLFYDPISGHFYDPESELWYDPSTEQWYQGAEQ